VKWFKWLAFAFVAYLVYRVLRAHGGGLSWRESFYVEVPVLGRLVGSGVTPASVHAG
jgi:hypothetical protein